MTTNRLARIETSLLASDAELLANVAAGRGTTVAELLRAAIYAHIEPLARAKRERDEIAYREMDERRKLRQWRGEDQSR